jgi:trimethylamine--corrinoid protein Co-methyltransferase
MLETSTVLSFEQLVLDGERVRDVRISIAPQDTGPDALAVDVVRKVGPGGHFLGQRHTVAHMKGFPISKYTGSSDAVDEKTGNEEGSPRQLARSEARRILETHRVEPLPEELEAALLKIAEAGAQAAVA